MSGFFTSVIETLNFLCERNFSIKLVTIIFGETMVVEIIWGGVLPIPWTLTNDEGLNSKSFEIMNLMTEIGVGQSLLIVISN